MPTMTIQEAQASLAELIHRLAPGEEVLITENNKLVARLLGSEVPTVVKQRKLGSLAGTVRYMAPDFDAALEDFKEYMG